MTDLVFWLLEAVSLLAALGALVAALRLIGGYGVGESGATAPRQRPPVSVMVPLRGADPGLERRLAVLVHATRPGDEILLAVETVHDTAHAVCEAFAQAAPEHERARVRVIVSGHAGQRMGKQHNLAAALAAATHPLVASMNGGVLLEPGHLDEGAALAGEEGAGIAFALPYVAGRGPLGDALVALYTNHYASLYLGALALQKAPRFIIGDFWLASRAALEAVGGLEPITRTVNDDAALGRAMAAAGRHNRPLRRPVRLAMERLDAAGGVRQVMARLTLLRAEGGGSYALIAALWHPVAWALLATLWAALSGGGSVGAGVFLLLVAGGARAAAVMMVNSDVYAAEPSGRYALLAPVYDGLVAPVLFVRAAGRREVSWRGRRYRFGRGGVIVAPREGGRQDGPDSTGA